MALRGRERRGGVWVYKTAIATEPPPMYDFVLGRAIARGVLRANHASARVAVSEPKPFPPLSAAIVERAEWRVLWAAKWQHT